MSWSTARCSTTGRDANSPSLTESRHRTGSWPAADEVTLMAESRLIRIRDYQGSALTPRITCSGNNKGDVLNCFQRPKTGLEPSRVVLYPFAQHSVRHGDPLERYGGRYNAPPLASRHRLQILGT